MTGPKVGLWEHFHTGSFRGSDIDLFVFGKTVAQANMKVCRERAGRGEGAEERLGKRQSDKQRTRGRSRSKTLIYE